MKKNFCTRTISLFILILSAHTLFGQFNENKYDKESFLVGALNEYMGYQRTFNESDDFYFQRVDILSQNQLQFALFIDSLFSPTYPDLYLVNNGAPMGIKIYSASLSKDIDNYYTYKSSGIRTGNGDTVYAGKIIPTTLATDKQQTSYLLGASLVYSMSSEAVSATLHRFQKDDDSTYFNTTEGLFGLSFPNGTSKAKFCKTLLKEFECDTVKYFYRNTIPAGHFVFFTPSPQVEVILKEANELSAYIQNISTKKVKFTTEGPKYFWKEPDRPTRLSKQ